MLNPASRASLNVHCSNEKSDVASAHETAALCTEFPIGGLSWVQNSLLSSVKDAVLTTVTATKAFQTACKNSANSRRKSNTFKHFLLMSHDLQFSH